MKVYLKIAISIIFLLLAPKMLAQEPVTLPDTIRVVGDKSMAPFDFINESRQPDGFAVDILKAVMKSLHMNYTLELTDFPSAISGLENGKYDLILQMMYSPSRADNYRLSYSYSDVKQCMAVRNNDITSIQNLNGKRVVLQRYNIFAEMLEKQGIKCEYIYINDIYQGIEAVRQGKADAVLNAAKILNEIIDKHKIKDVKTIIIPGTCELSMATQRPNVELMHKIDDAIVQLKISGEYDHIYNKWFRKYLAQDDSIFWQYVIMAFSIIILLAIIVIIIIQRRINKSRNEINEANNMIRISSHKFEALFNAMDVAVEYYDAQGNIVDYNEKCSEMWCAGNKAEVLAKRNNLFSYPIISDENKAKIRNGERVNYITEYDFDYIKKLDIVDVNRSDKRIFSVDISPVKDAKGKSAGYVITTTDITEIKNYQKQLERSKMRWKNLYRENMNIFSAMPIGISMYDKNGYETFLNQKMADVLAIPNIEAHLARHIYIYDNPVLTEEIKETLKRGENVNEVLCCEMSKITSSGYYETNSIDTLLIEIKIRILYDADMEMSGYIIIIRDLTDIERKQKEILESKATNEMVLNNINTMLVFLSNDYIVGWNNLDHFKSIIKHTPMEGYVPGTQCYKYIHGLDAPCENCCLKKAFEIKKPVTIQRVYCDGKLIVHITAIPLFESDGSLKGGLFKVEDVSELMRQHRELEIYEAKTQLIIDTCEITQWDYDLKRKASIVDHPSSIMRNQWFSEEQYLSSVHPDDHILVHNLYKRMNAAEDKAMNARFRSLLIGRDGYRNVEMNCVPIKDNDGNIVLYTGLRRDITEDVKILARLNDAKQKAESSLSMLNDIIEHMPLAIYIKDTVTHKYTMVNELFAKLQQKKKDEIIGMADYEVFPEEIVKEYRKTNKDAINAAGMSTYSIKVFNIEGRDTIVESNQMLVKVSDGHDLIVGLMSNVTEREQARLELEEAKERAEESDRLKSAFLANMSHEIRTPLNAIVGFSNLLSISDNKSDKEEYMKIISTNNDLLLRLIGDILDMSKIESGVVDFEYHKFDMSEFFNEYMQTMKQKCTNPDVKLKIENPYKHCEINLDRNRLGQVINNYMTNAIKYTPSGQITAKYKYEGDTLTISVSDTGIGIPEDKKSKIFQRFEKIDTFAQGNGLGLSISKAIVERFGGKVGFESIEGQGSTFWASIPVKAIISD